MKAAKLMLGFIGIATVSACGGASTSTQIPITNFPDGRSFVRISTPEYSGIALVKDPSFDVSNLTNVQIVTALETSELSDGAFSGRYIIQLADGSTTTAVGQGYDEQQARMFMVRDNLTDSVRVSVVDGTKVKNMPTGTFNYNGHAYMEYSWPAEKGWWSENGDMAMTVNFSNKSASVSASSDYVSYNANGLAVDANTGVISGTDGSYVILDNDGATYSTNNIPFHGNLTGDNAEYISGAAYRYVSNDDYQLIGVIGKR